MPVTLVTGFLGSGKTTLVNALLRDPAFSGSMVVVNEFGAVGLDHLLVSQSRDNVLLLDSGCLCCAASGSLQDTLIDLFARRASGSVPDFDRIIVETSGLASPAPLVATLLGSSALATRCRLAQVLTLIDATNATRVLASHAEAVQQVALADRLVITKSELSTSDAVRALRATLRRLNPHAPIVLRRAGEQAARHFVRHETEAGEATAKDQYGASASADRLWILSRGPVRKQYGGDEGLRPDDGASLAFHDLAHARITTHTWRVPEVQSWTSYAACTQALRTHAGGHLLRCKGLLAIESPDRPWVIQGVQGFFAPPSALQSWPGNTAEGFIVCIGESLPHAQLASCMSLLHAVPYTGQDAGQDAGFQKR